MKKLLYILLFSILGIGIGSFVTWRKSVEQLQENSFVLDLLIKLGDKKPLHYVENIEASQVAMGKDLVMNGWTTRNEKKSKRISKYFVCTDCHNTVNEEEDLKNPTPEGRLKYVSKNNLPFLQGSPLYGVVNRKTWYNGDYVKKYGDWVIPARDTLENAIQLCAKVCSQGRELEQWEMNAMMHYLHTIGYQKKELGLTASEKNRLAQDTISNEAKKKIIESKYLNHSPATFLEITEQKDRAYGRDGNPENGKLIYDLSCKHCHGHENPATSLKIDDSKLTFKLFKSKLKKDSRFSLYNIVRKGTYADAGMRAYMPHYTAERMSDQQLEDLVSYIKQEAK